jgi:hypothetical protein
MLLAAAGLVALGCGRAQPGRCRLLRQVIDASGRGAESRFSAKDASASGFVGLERILDRGRVIMKLRDTWLLEDVNSFDEPSDWTMAAELSTVVRSEIREDDGGFRALLEDPEAGWLE